MLLQTIGGAAALGFGSKYMTSAMASEQTSKDTVSWNGARGDAGRTGRASTIGPTGPYGIKEWTQRASSWYSDSPTIANGTVYTGVLIDDRPWIGEIVAYDIETGELKWSRANRDPDSEEQDPIGWARHAPVYDNGTLYFTAKPSPEHNWISGGVYALDANSGDLSWWREDILDQGRLEVASNRVFVGTHTLDATTGETLWTTDTDEIVIGVADNVVYSRLENPNNEYNDWIIARSIATGAELWRTESPAYGFYTAVTSETLFLTGFEDRDSNTRFAWALSANDGGVCWRSEVPIQGGGDSPMISAPAVDGSHLYCFTRGAYDSSYNSTSINDVEMGIGTVYAFDRETGAFAWRFETPAQLEAAPSVASNCVYVSARYYACPETVDNPPYQPKIIVYALDSETGAEKWSYAFASGDYFTPTDPSVGEERVFIGINDPIASGASLYAIGETTTEPSCSEIVADENATRTIPEPDDTTATEEEDTTTESDSEESTSDETTEDSASDDSSTEDDSQDDC
ncbi:PQQ-binding-like beta-propeller repeat protein [Haladaptatus sp. W1]|uniref:outer membrane protein assembly factor BamB family protein n=1 Tax=Haladaptatus sp. W1 TaxID=1897478 RepID=UPI001C2F422F|nr:PQQ-binding-like beta-propeller repeat protein [Haladaptatus sp. W1]